MCQLHSLNPHKKVSHTKHLYVIGSILLGYHDATIWGSGFGYDKPPKWYTGAYNFFHRIYHKTDIRTVRGPETRRILHQMGITCPESYGDPAVLMPLFYQSPTLHKTKKYLIIPHYSKLGNYVGVDNVLGTFTKDYRSFIDTLLQAELVISSSLHGIILAEAYGIPCVMLNDTPTPDITKYKDWYYSTGRSSFPIATSVNEALALGGTPLDYTEITKMQQHLLDTFPIDLWE